MFFILEILFVSSITAAAALGGKIMMAEKDQHDVRKGYQQSSSLGQIASTADEYSRSPFHLMQNYLLLKPQDQTKEQQQQYPMEVAFATTPAPQQNIDEHLYPKSFEEPVIAAVDSNRRFMAEIPWSPGAVKAYHELQYAYRDSVISKNKQNPNDNDPFEHWFSGQMQRERSSRFISTEVTPPTRDPAWTSPAPTTINELSKVQQTQQQITNQEGNKETHRYIATDIANQQQPQNQGAQFQQSPYENNPSQQQQQLQYPAQVLQPHQQQEPYQIGYGNFVPNVVGRFQPNPTKPPLIQSTTAVSHQYKWQPQNDNSYEAVPTEVPPAQQPLKEQVQISTLIQVFSPLSKNGTNCLSNASTSNASYGPSQSFALAEAQTLSQTPKQQQLQSPFQMIAGPATVPEGTKRVIIRAMLDPRAKIIHPLPRNDAIGKDSVLLPNQRQLVEELLPQLERENGNMALINAIGASNASSMSEQELRSEVAKELEQSIPTIIDQLEKVKQADQTAPGKTELERLILEGLTEVESTTSSKEAPMVVSTISSSPSTTSETSMVTKIPTGASTTTKEEEELGPVFWATELINTTVLTTTPTSVPGAITESTIETLSESTSSLYVSSAMTTLSSTSSSETSSFSSELTESRLITAMPTTELPAFVTEAEEISTITLPSEESTTGRTESTLTTTAEGTLPEITNAENTPEIVGTEAFSPTSPSAEVQQTETTTTTPSEQVGSSFIVEVGGEETTTFQPILPETATIETTESVPSEAQTPEEASLITTKTTLTEESETMTTTNSLSSGSSEVSPPWELGPEFWITETVTSSSPSELPAETTTSTSQIIGVETTTITSQTAEEWLSSTKGAEITPMQDISHDTQGIHGFEQFDAGYIAVDCLPDGIRATFLIRPSYRGVVFAREAYRDPKCYVEIPTTTLPNQSTNVNATADENLVIKGSLKQTSIEIHAPDCNLTTTESPDGSKNLSIVIVLSSHRELITQTPEFVFSLQCLIPPESDSTVQTHLVVETAQPSLVSSKIIAQEMTPPKCRYTLRSESPNGPAVLNATIGQTIYHTWECTHTTNNSALYGMNVHSCLLSNDKQEIVFNPIVAQTTPPTTLSNDEEVKTRVPMIFRTIDELGCPTEPALIDQVHYDSDRLFAYARAVVFSLRDIQQVEFVCKIRLCPKNASNETMNHSDTRDTNASAATNNRCYGITPPICSTNSENNSEAHFARNLRNLEDPTLVSLLTTVVHSPKIKMLDNITKEPIQHSGENRHITAAMLAALICAAALAGALIGLFCFCVCRQRDHRYIVTEPESERPSVRGDPIYDGQCSSNRSQPTYWDHSILPGANEKLSTNNEFVLSSPEIVEERAVDASPIVSAKSSSGHTHFEDSRDCYADELDNKNNKLKNLQSLNLTIRD